MKIMAWLHRFSPFISLGLFALAMVVVHHEIKVYHWQEIKGALFALPPLLFVGACGLTLLGYAVLSFYDRLGLEYAGTKLSYPRVFLVSFLSYAISNNVGYAWLSGGALRVRMYSSWGVPAVAIAKVIVFCGITYFIGAATLLAGSYFLAPDLSLLQSEGQRSAIQISILLALFFLVVWAALVVFCRKPITLKWVSIILPRPWLAARQWVVALIDVMIASLVLYLPLSHFIQVPFSEFVTIFVAAQLLGLLSQVPGGIGVFEGSFLLLASNQFPSSYVLAALISYRAIYFFFPLSLAGVLLGIYELRRLPVVGTAMSALQAVTPQLFSALLLFCGAVLLVSGATPVEPERMLFLRNQLPLPLIEFSHLTGSITGVILLFLSRAVHQKLDSAYYATVVALSVGIFTLLARGFEYEGALALGFLLLIFIPARKCFYRKSALLALHFPPRWLAVVALILGLSAWLGFFSYRHVKYADALWWQFSLYGDAPRFLRSLAAIAVCVLGALFYRILTKPMAVPVLPDKEILAKAYPLVLASGQTMPHLALTGDKRLLWSPSGKSFLMFGVTPKYWVALGDPVGEDSEWDELIWQFRELADRHGAKVAFYQVSNAYLPLYIDLGLALVKLGQEARVPLAEFGLEGKKYQSLRHAFNKCDKEGMTFEVVTEEEAAGIIGKLRDISERWLTMKQVREKHFSLGWFDEAYITRGAVAVVKKDGDILAFANLWETEGKEELSLDLMRYDPDAPNGVMEYLMVSLMLWGKEQGYRWFNLGMAPLSGLERRALAPLWHKIGNLIFHFGGDFYNFEGLYHYKKKFKPVWRPRYLAAPPGLHTARVLLAVTSLISGNLKGTFGK